MEATGLQNLVWTEFDSLGMRKNLNNITMLYILSLILFGQYLIVILDIIFENTTKKELKTDIIPFVGIFIKVIKQINKLPEK